MFRKILLALLLAMTSFVLASSLRAAESGPVILTVTGNVAQPNRGPMNPFEDPVFDHLQARFDKGFTFTLADLKALPQKSVTAKYAGWPREVTATGPSLVDVLKAAGAEGKKILVQATDGYAPEFKGADVAQDKMILAVEADGKPLHMGGRGPLWLFGPAGSFTGQEQDEGFVFAVIRIDVQ